MDNVKTNIPFKNRIRYICSMDRFPKKLISKLLDREAKDTLRALPEISGAVDFSSNDYLGLAQNETVFHRASKILSERQFFQNGSTGSRLLSGNNKLYSELEEMIADFHGVEAALVFNSGYDANMGFFASVPQRGDFVFYDELIHASIRDGIVMGNAKSYKFKHNDLEDLGAKVSLSLRAQSRSRDCEIYVVTESVFSMDGNTPDLKAFTDFCEKNNCRLVVDEAHAVGVFGAHGRGLLHESGLHGKVFAGIVTFGKAMGCHGAAILGSKALKSYLVNFARSFIYTTAMPPHSLATILAAYHFSMTPIGLEKRRKLIENIQHFNLLLKTLNLEPFFIPSNSAVHCCILPGNKKVKGIAKKLGENGFVVKPILSPTVPEGQERLRFCLHSFNTKKEISRVLKLLGN